MDTRRRLLAVIMGSILMFGCGGSKSEPAKPHPTASEAHAHGEAAMGGTCPMDVPGTKVSVADTPDGVAITFTTTSDVAELRQRVHHVAEMHEHRMQGGMGSGGMGSGHMMMKMVPSTARAEDVDGGARIALTPNDPAQLADLRAHVHEHAAQMANGHCPTMEHHG
jgi:hypothetical protein